MKFVFRYCFYAILIIPILIACSPDRFILNKVSGEYGIVGKMKRSLYDVEVKYDNAFVLNENACVSLQASGKTECTWDFTLTMLAGKELEIGIRNIDYQYKPSSAITIKFTDRIVEINEKGNLVYQSILRNSFDEPRRVNIYNNGKKYFLKIDCDTIFIGKTSIPATEYLILESKNNTKCFFSGIDVMNN